MQPADRDWRVAPALRHFYFFVDQHVHQANQWQADQAGGVFALGAAKQADAQTFGLEAAGAIEWLLALQVAQDLLVAQWAKMHGEGYAFDLAFAGARIEQCQSGQKGDAATAGGAQLLLGSRQIVGFAEYLSIAECGDLGPSR